MCKGKSFCTELGEVSTWSKKSTLLPPEWVSLEVDRFIESVEAAAGGDVDLSIKLLNKINSDKLRNWFVVHGQNAGYYRNAFFNISEQQLPNKECLLKKDKTISKKHEIEVLLRDGYTCQYCGGKLIPNEVLKNFSECVGAENF